MSVKFLQEFVAEEIKQVLREKGVAESASSEAKERALVEFYSDGANPRRLAKEYEQRHNVTATEGEFRHAISQDSCLEFRLGVALENNDQRVVLEELSRRYCIGKRAECGYRKPGELPFCGRDGNSQYESTIISREFLRKFDESFMAAIRNHKWFASEQAHRDVGDKFALSDFAARYAGDFCKNYAGQLAAALEASFTGAKLVVNLKARVHVHEDKNKDVVLEDYTAVHEFNGRH